MLSVKRKGMVGQSKAAPAAQWMQFKKHSSQHHRWCSRAVVFFTRCQESKPANPLRLEAVCMFPSKFHWGLLCYLAHALHPAELKCSQLKVCWRQQLCCSKLEKAGKGKSWKGKVLWYCQKWSTSRPSNPPLLQPLLLITIVVRKHQANSTNECLINTPSCSRRRQATCSWLIPPLSLSLSFSAFLYLSLSSTSVCIFPSIPPTPLRQRRTKGETEEKQYNLLALFFGAHQSMSGLRQGFACPLKELISLWFQPNGSAQWQMLNFPSATLTPISLVLLNLTDFVWTVCLAVWIRLWHGCWCEC